MTTTSEEPRESDPLKSQLKFVIAIVCALFFAISMMYLYDQFFYYSDVARITRGDKPHFEVLTTTIDEYAKLRFVFGLVGLVFGLFSGMVFGEFIYRKSGLK
jgi:hypothetical protein